MKHSQNLIYSEFLRECTLLAPDFPFLYLRHSAELYWCYNFVHSGEDTWRQDFSLRLNLLTNSFKIKCKIVPIKYMKAYGGVEVLSPPTNWRCTRWRKWSDSRSGPFIPEGKTLTTHRVAGRMRPKPLGTVWATDKSTAPTGNRKTIHRASSYLRSHSTGHAIPAYRPLSLFIIESDLDDLIAYTAWNPRCEHTEKHWQHGLKIS